MPTIQPQIWKGSPFTIERKEGKAPGTLIFRLTGPFTARDMYGSLAPDALGKMLDFQSPVDSRPPALNILDLTDVPYMDSSGLGIIVRHSVRCKSKGVRLLAAGVSPRVLELFKMTKVDDLFPMTATVEEADTP
jgi:anti-anti-sigma factor